MGSPWRRPAEESDDLYPDLSVNDGRQTGSIVIGGSRLPLWAFIHSAVTEGWDEVEDSYEPGRYGFTVNDLAGFLYWLLEARGEFGRLLLALAHAERAQHEIEAEDTESHFAQAHPCGSVCECGRPSLPAWWQDPEQSSQVVELLRRCLAVLEVDGQ